MGPVTSWSGRTFRPVAVGSFSTLAQHLSDTSSHKTHMSTSTHQFHPPSATKKMARARLPPEVRRQQILEAALKEFGALGFAAASIAAIARRAGMSKANLYVHFTDKGAIFEAMLTQWLRPSDEVPAPQPGQSPDELIDSLIDNLYRRLTPKAVVLIRLLIAEAHRVPHLVERWFEVSLMPARIAQQRRVDELVTTGSLRATALTQDFNFTTIPLLYAAVTPMILPEEQACVEFEMIKEAHRNLLHLLIKPAPGEPPNARD